MIRNVTADLYQLGECVDGENGHEAVRVYLLINDQTPILIDSGSHLHRTTIMQDLDALLEDAAPAYVFLTHSELPHAGNLLAVIRKWPGIRVIVSNVMLPYIEITSAVPAEQIIVVYPGEALVVGARRLHFLSALLKDQPGSHWIYDEETGALFTGDGFGYYHPPGECELFSSEMEAGVETARFQRFHSSTFKFLRWVLPEKVNPDLERLFDAWPVRLIAPAHGNAIFEVPEHVARLEEAVKNIYLENQAPDGDARGR